ncbi:MAG: bifunctional folylpolyglutamate synthase/dihydrofolate synthase [Thermoplasmatota archaeon]
MTATAWTYSEALAWLYARQNLGIKLGLDKVRRLLAALGDPQQRFQAVHVAGTNGKGSVSRLVAAALQGGGHKVGLTTSPHLIRFTERIEVDGEPIGEAEAAAGLARIAAACEPLDADGEPPTFFECVTALAFLVFAERGVDWAVVETGMGGRLDATNVLTPALTVVTNVSLDHAAFLGDHIGAIAIEKAGILKPGVPCVTAATGDALTVLKVTSQTLRVPMSVVGEDYLPQADLGGFRLLTPVGEAHYELALAGEHQLENAALAVAACDALRQGGVALPPAAVQGALATTQVPGRLEMLTADGDDRLVDVLLDGAHNEAGAVALRRHLAHLDWGGFHLVVGFSADKPWQDLLDQWWPLAAKVWAVPLRSGRSLDPEAVVAHLAGEVIPAEVAPSAQAALQGALDAGAGKVLVAGSLFLIGEARAVLTGQSLEEVRGDQ